MGDQLMGGMVNTGCSSARLFSLGGSSFRIRTSSLREVMKWSTSNRSWNSLPGGEVPFNCQHKATGESNSDAMEGYRRRRATWCRPRRKFCRAPEQ